jgi:putative photosynthetic complex assembly protein
MSMNGLAARGASAPAPAKRSFPRGALWIAAGMIGLALLLAILGRTTGFGTLRMPEATFVEYRDIRFLDGDAGTVVVLDGTNGRRVAVLPSGSDGFIRGVMRGFARDRKARGIGDEIPFRLGRAPSGQLILRDPVLDREIVVDAFGRTNVEAFARLLARGEGDK